MSTENNPTPSEAEEYKKYTALKKLLVESQSAINGELVPKNNSEFESLKKDIEEIEQRFPHFNFFRSSEKES